MGLIDVISSLAKKGIALFVLWFIALIVSYFLSDTVFYALLVIALICFVLLIVLVVVGVMFFPAILEFIGVDAATAASVASAHAAAHAPPPPGSPPPAPAGITFDGAKLIKDLLLIIVCGAGFYFLVTNIGLTALPTVLTIFVVGGLVLGALRGVSICVLALWVFAFLCLEGLVFWLFSFLPGQALFTGIAVFFVIIFSFIAPKIGGKHTKAVGFIVLLATIALGVLVFHTDTFKPYLTSGSQLQKAFDAQRDSWFGVYNALVTSIPGLITQSREQLNRQINIATGDYESGVEAQSTKQLGVFLENLGMTETQVRKDGTVDFYARLRAESFTTSASAEPLLITVKCYDDKTSKSGSIRPQDTFTVEEYESLDIDCLFDARELAVGSNTLALEATFTFTTNAFLKSYFMDQETIRSYTRQREDPLDAFQITDKNPSTVYTAGPMRIGMSAGKQPIALIADRNEGPTLSVTIERSWLDGELLSLDELSITVPPGLQIESVSGEKVGSFCSSSTTQEQVCTFGPDFISKIVTDLKKPFTTLRVFTTKRDSTKLLGGAPLAIRSFKTEIRYTYRIKKTQTVLVKEAT